ncbi:hypothetical protein BC937DRAFT_88658 [Endogone sp. FLAS-F59071]|nr:hypothetical protein BC937DRAFT_88658 [Endogone sp. FLAS-F59071]|eukprot:RUS22515.1 hypothetical protein BC937DRAFT_88658 [Endogone sp. FLAS-F59071]
MCLALHYIFPTSSSVLIAPCYRRETSFMAFSRLSLRVNFSGRPRYSTAAIPDKGSSITVVVPDRDDVSDGELGFCKARFRVNLAKSGQYP